jgi:plasmid stability protein
MAAVKQMITRLDDELHAGLKARAAAEGRSLNDLIVEALTELVREPLTRSVLRERLRKAGCLVVPEETTRPDPEVVRAALANAGTSVSEALEADRDEGW